MIDNTQQNFDLYNSPHWDELAIELSREISRDKAVQSGTYENTSRELVPFVFPDGKIGAYIVIDGNRVVPLWYNPEKFQKGEALPDFKTLPDLIQKVRLKVLSKITTDVPLAGGRVQKYSASYNGSLPALELPDFLKQIMSMNDREEMIKAVLSFQKNKLLEMIDSDPS